jgi:hypothetical protein
MYEIRTLECGSIFEIDKPQRMLHKNCDRKVSVKKEISGRDSQGGLAPRRNVWR